MRVEGTLLGDVADPALLGREMDFARPRHYRAPDHDRAVPLPDEAHDHPQQRRLAAT
jgi:hypothetical protein